MTSEKEKFARRLNQALDDVGLARMGQGRQTSLARDMNLPSQVVGKWLKGEDYPKTSQLVKLAQYTGVRSNWLLSGIGEKYPSAVDHKPASDPGVMETGSDYSPLSLPKLTQDAFDIAVIWMKLPLLQRNALRKVISELAEINE